MPPKKEEQRARRTVKACVICHKKKVRCDIDDVDGHVCTPCARDGYECVPRERKRKRFTFSPSPPANRRTKTGPENGQGGFNTTPTSNETSQKADHPYYSNGVGMHHDGSGTLKSENELARRLSNAASLHESSPYLERHTESEHPTLQHANSIPSTMTESTYPSSASNANTVSYLGRLEYLRNDVPVNDDAGLPNKVPHRLSETDLEILRVQRVSELPPRAVRESLMDAFWARCYPWTPVVERSWLEHQNPNKVSLLLQHAIFLAGSRVTAPLPNFPPEDFYKRARVLFWMGAEENPIITLAAACLLHWWNPEGPERVSLDTSAFWMRICVGLAYQLGLHREPQATAADAGLRKRLWWSLVVRDSLISAGHGRPRAIDLKLADVSPISALDFDGAVGPASLFSAYVGISCILGDLTQSYLRKHGLQEHKKSFEDRLFRWLKSLPPHLHLCEPMESRPLKQYSFEVRQLHIQYFAVLVILFRPSDPQFPSSASLLASSFIAGIFEDFMARDEIRFLGPIFTFYCLTAGMAQLSCYRYSGLVDTAEETLAIIGRALEELSKRWPSGVGSLKHLMDVREKVTQRPLLGQFPDANLPPNVLDFFTDFGPDLCRMWHPIFDRLPQTTPIEPRELETAGILQGLRVPAATTQSIELDMNANGTAQSQLLVNQMPQPGANLEPTLLQPQEWFQPYGAIGNWLMGDWDQGYGW